MECDVKTIFQNTTQQGNARDSTQLTTYCRSLASW